MELTFTQPIIRFWYIQDDNEKSNNGIDRIQNVYELMLAKLFSYL